MVMINIPPTTRSFFQEYAFEKLDPTQHRDLIIERLFSYGNREEIRWLYQTYGQDKLRDWVGEMGARRLSRLRYNLWCVIFKLQPDLEVLKKRIWPH